MHQEPWFATTMALIAAFVGISATHADGDAPPASAEPRKVQSRSRLYDGFDAQKLMETYRSRFDATPRHANVVTNIQITPPGDIFKLFRVKGNISEPELDKMLNSMRAELRDLAKTSGVRVICGPTDKIGDRPIHLLTVLFLGETVELKTLRGSYFTYEEGKIKGAVDILAVRCVAEATKQWKIVCAVHEQVQ